jgi:hypothetical protein
MWLLAQFPVAENPVYQELDDSTVLATRANHWDNGQHAKGDFYNDDQPVSHRYSDFLLNSFGYQLRKSKRNKKDSARPDFQV